MKFGFLKNAYKSIWIFIKNFPVSCYGGLSLITYNIFSYDFFIIGLLPGYPFIWLVGNVIKLIFPEDFLRVASQQEGLGLKNLIIVSCIALLISVILDLLIQKIRKKGLKTFFKK